MKKIFLLLILPAIAGCNLIGAPLSILTQNQTKKYPAEYADLPGKSLVIWVWADDSLLFDYPVIRYDVANHTKYFLSRHVKNLKIVDPASVAKFQRTQYEADTMLITQIGKKFNTDIVLFIQVSDFITRPADAPNLFQGNIKADCALYDSKGGTTVRESKLWSGVINVTYPDHPVGMYDASDLAIRSMLLKLFGETLAKKFYEYRQ